MRQSRNVLTIVLLGLFGVAAVAYAATRHSQHHPSFLLGDRSIERDADSEAAGRAEAFQFHATNSGAAKWVALFLGAANKARTVKVAIYSDSKGHPGKMLGSGVDRQPRAGAWNHIRIGHVQMRHGKAYWLAVLGGHGTMVYRDRAHGSCASEESAQRHLTAFSRSWHAGPRGRSCPVSAAVSSTKSITLAKPGGGSNSGGKSPTQPTPPTGSPAPPSTTPAPNGKDCVHNLVGCGYPDPSTTGVPAGTSLTPSGSFAVHTDGAVISNLNVTGTIDIYASNVTIKDTRVTTVNVADPGIVIHAPATGDVIEDTSVGGPNPSVPSGLAIHNTTPSSLTVVRTFINNATDGVVGLQRTSDSYIITDGSLQALPSAHVEPVYIPGGNGPNGAQTTIEHNTLLNPQNQVAAVFGDDHAYGPLNNISVDNNIMAGGDFVVELGCPGDGNTNISVTNNRFSRIYYPKGGQYGASGVNVAVTAWSGNVWDDTLKSVGATNGCGA